jgi:L-aminopeptidase/D-esterase-like protein
MSVMPPFEMAPILCLPGLRLGHADLPRAATGVSALVFEQPAIASISTLGGAPGGRDTALLEPEMSVERVDALLLSGGSAFGLDAAGGAMRALAGMGRGLVVGSARIPIVPQAIVFDLLNGGDKTGVDYGALGASAIGRAVADIPLGSVGAGLGATTATLKGGFGAAEAKTRSGFSVQAFVVVNAIGTATLPTGEFLAAPWEQAGEFGGRGLPAPLPEAALRLRLKGHAREPATTIGVVVTDAALTKVQAKRLAIMAQDGLARALRPAHAPMDGDTIFAAALGHKPLVEPLYDLTELGMLAGDCVTRAIALGIYHARALPFPGALPDWQTRFGAFSTEAGQ